MATGKLRITNHRVRSKESNIDDREKSNGNEEPVEKSEKSLVLETEGKNRDKDSRLDKDCRTTHRIKIKRTNTIFHQDKHKEISDDESRKPPDVRKVRCTIKKRRTRWIRRGTDDEIENEEENENSSDARVYKNKRDYLRKGTEIEYRRAYDWSEDDEPSWDQRVRDVERKQEEIALRKLNEAKNIPQQDNKQQEDSDSDYESKEDSAATANHEFGRDSNWPDQEYKDMTETETTDDGTLLSNSTARWVQAEVDSSKVELDENTPEAECKPEAIKKANEQTEDEEIDDDEWFWGSHGKAQERKKKRSTDNQKNNVYSGWQVHAKVAIKDTINADLKRYIDKLQLNKFKSNYYQKLQGSNRSSDSNSTVLNSSRSSTSSDKIDKIVSSSAEDNDNDSEEPVLNRAKTYNFLDDSSDEGHSDDRPTPSQYKIKDGGWKGGRKKEHDRRPKTHDDARETTTDSSSTLSTDTEESSSLTDGST